FTAIQLQLDSVAKLRIGKIAQNENGLYNAAERSERSRESVRRGCVRKPLNDDIGRRSAVLERSRHTHQRVALFAEQMGIRYAVKQRIEASVISLAAHLIKEIIGQTAQPGHKGIAQKITQSKDVFREAVRIRVVLPQSQDRVVFQKAIEHIRWNSGLTLRTIR